MKESKDNFSEGSVDYKKFRPVYPEDLYRYIFSHVTNYNYAWDCGTGNGQVAEVLSEYFDQVIATDLSEQQICLASVKPNVTYKVHRAEQPFLENQKFDLITVGQAAHWFDLPRFFNNALTHLVDDGLLALWGYGLLSSSGDVINEALTHFYKNIVGPYWDDERKHIDERYTKMHHDTLALIDSDNKHTIKVEWNSDRLKAYLKTWSSVRHYIKQNKKDPVDIFFDDYSCMNYIDKQTFQFPIFIRLFKKKTC